MIGYLWWSVRHSTADFLPESWETSQFIGFVSVGWTAGVEALLYYWCLFSAYDDQTYYVSHSKESPKSLTSTCGSRIKGNWLNNKLWVTEKELHSTPYPLFPLLFFLFSCRWWAHLVWWWSRQWSSTRASIPKRGRTTPQHGTAFSAQVQTQNSFFRKKIKDNKQSLNCCSPFVKLKHSPCRLLRNTHTILSSLPVRWRIGK